MNDSPGENDYFRINLSKLLRERIADDDFLDSCRSIDLLWDLMMDQMGVESSRQSQSQRQQPDDRQSMNDLVLFN